MPRQIDVEVTPLPIIALTATFISERRYLQNVSPKPVRLVYDRSRLGDKAYFEDATGVLLDVQGTSLIFTSPGGEASLVIPASEIVEIRMNTLVGRTVGALHIATRRGLYLNLAPESGDREEAEPDVEALTKRLGLTR